MFLNKILEKTREDLQKQKAQCSFSDLRRETDTMLKNMSPARSFKKAISNTGSPVIIAEIKKASPSKGLICKDFNALEIAREYTQGGAAAISVLTEKHYFQGDIRYLNQISSALPTPLLRKDFIIDSYQLYESLRYGASAVLLIMAILSEHQAKEYVDICRELKLDVLCEVHNENELDMALNIQADIIGVNNRNLETFEVDIKTSARLSSLIPKDIIKVSESGITNDNDIRYLEKYGFHAFLIGESLMKENDRSIVLRKLRAEHVG